MTTIDDQASDNEMMERNLSIKLVREQAAKQNTYSGHCLSCNAPLKIGRVCDRYCKEDYELLLRIQQIKGIKR